MFHLTSPTGSFLHHLLHPVANDPRPFTALFIHFSSFSSLLPFLYSPFFLSFIHGLTASWKINPWIQVQAFDILVNYSSLFCIVAQCFRVCMKYRQIGKMSEVYKLCFSIFFGWQDLFDCTRFVGFDSMSFYAIFSI